MAATASGAASALLRGKYAVVYVTVPSVEVGTKIARSIVERHLAACVNVVPQLTSIYSWKGKIEEDAETMLIIKTKNSALEELKTAVTALHPYEVPEFISMPIDYGSEPFLNWLDGQVQVLNAEHRNSTATDSGCSASSQSQSQTAASAHPTAAVETATDGSSEKNKI